MEKFYIKMENGAYLQIDASKIPEGVQIYVKINDNFFPVMQGGALPQAPVSQPQAPAMKTEDDPIKELTGLIREMAGNMSNIRAKEEEVNAKIAAYQEMTKKGLPIPNVIIPQGSPLAADMSKSCLKRVNMAVQGKNLMDKRFYPKYQIQDNETRLEIAKYLSLFIKGGILNYTSAKQEFWDTYGPQLSAERKTEIGDSGNTFPVTNRIEAEIIAFAREQSVMLQYGTVIDMNTEKDTYPAESGSASVSWGNTTPASDPTVTDVELACDELSAYSTAKNTTLDDSPSDIVSWLFSNMAEATALEIDNACFNGDGTSTYGSITGIFSAAGFTVTFGSGLDAFTDLSWTHLSEAISKLDGLRKQGARFFMNGAILHLVRLLADDNNRPIFIETVGSSIPPAILGYPYTEAIKCPSTSAASTPFIIFGNLKHFYVGRRQGVTNLQVNPYEKWTTNRTCFKIYSRWAGKVALANGLVIIQTALSSSSSSSSSSESSSNSSSCSSSSSTST